MIKFKLNTNNLKVANSRAKTFKTLIDSRKDRYKYVENGDSTYTVFFDIELLPEDKQKAVTTLLKFNKESLETAIFDVTTDLFEHEEIGPVLTLCIVCAGFVTCSSPYMQEVVYMNTGRLAAIVEDPITKDSLKEPDSNEGRETENTKITWFGTPEEIFSIRKEEKHILTEHNDLTLNKVMVRGIMQDKKLANTDIVYLPKTYKEESEDVRVSKAIFAILNGKFLIAPELNEQYKYLSHSNDFEKSLRFYRTGDMETWIAKTQKTLEKREGLSKVKDQFMSAIDMVPTDDFLNNLEHYLDSDEIKI